MVLFCIDRMNLMTKLKISIIIKKSISYPRTSIHYFVLPLNSKNLLAHWGCGGQQKFSTSLSLTYDWNIGPFHSINAYTFSTLLTCASEPHHTTHNHMIPLKHCFDKYVGISRAFLTQSTLFLGCH